MQIPDTTTKKSLVSLTSLIDVVFILLVFFMLTSSFMKWNFIELGTNSSNGQAAEDIEQSIIHVGLNQEYLFNDKKVTLEDMLIQVKELITKDKKHPVLIQPTDDLPLQELVIVLDAVGKIAEKNISLVKEEK